MIRFFVHCLVMTKWQYEKKERAKKTVGARAGKHRIAIGTAPIPPMGYVDLNFNTMKGSPSHVFGRVQLAKLVRPCNIREGQGIYPSSLTQRP